MNRKPIAAAAAALLLLWAGTGRAQGVSAQESVQVSTGAVCILKTDPAGNPLQGAAFSLARQATPEEIQDPGIIKEALVVGNQEELVVFVPFYASGIYFQELTYQAETDRTGALTLSGLPYGNYFLLENQAPEGYEKLEDPLVVRVSATSGIVAADGILDDQGHLIDNTVHIVNRQSGLPQTGGPGTRWIQLTGALVLGAAGLLLAMNARRQV